MTKLQGKNNADLISIAPMLDWTDTHFRSFIRLICQQAMLYTEMVACPALILGDRSHLLSYQEAEHPLTLQVGGSDPKMMAECAQMAWDYGYRGININAGCPSSRVQSGRFGAILMRTPELVAECVSEMVKRTPLPVSVKTRIALSDTPGDGFQELFHFTELIAKAGCRHIIVHARKAKLNISPKDNRQKLPLNYDVVYRLKKSFPDLFISINGNISSFAEITKHLSHTDGVMIGRWAYGNPYALSSVDQTFFDDSHPILSRTEIFQAFLPYLAQHRDKLSVICPHLMGLFHGEPCAKTYRQILASCDWDEIQKIPERCTPLQSVSS